MTAPPPIDLEYPVTLLCGTALLIASGAWPSWWLRGAGLALLLIAVVGPNVISWAARKDADA